MAKRDVLDLPTLSREKCSLLCKACLVLLLCLLSIHPVCNFCLQAGDSCRQGLDVCVEQFVVSLQISQVKFSALAH
eukprot:m.113239 g.113239  ORF g.113239 m.113239 type:complete len:76 (-) comp13506_c2_seq3:150-377(-)